MNLSGTGGIGLALSSQARSKSEGPGRNRRELMTRAYWEFLVHGEQLQAPIPTTNRVQAFTRPFREG